MNTAKPWLKNYPAGVPAQLILPTQTSLVDLLDESFARYPKRNAIESMGHSFSYEELNVLSEQFASYLQSLDLPMGSRVAIMLPNVTQYLIAMLGVLRAGLVVVNVNPLYTSRELEHQLNDSQALVLVLSENFANIYQQIAEKTTVKRVIVSSLGDLLGPKGLLVNFAARYIKKIIPQWSFPHTRFTDALQLGKQHLFQKPTIDPNAIAFLQYTGGTTGVSKGAILLHRNVLANVLQTDAWLEPVLRDQHDQQLVFLCALPMTHIFALTACALLGLRKGGLLLLVANPRDITGLIKLLAKHPEVNIFPGVNTLFHALVHRPEFSKLKLSNLLVTIGGGMAMQKKTADHWQAITGNPIAQGYGLSETSPVVCVNTPLIEKFTGHIGLPLPNTDVVILGEDGKRMPMGEAGEICIQGPQVMAGYWNQPEETRKAFTVDGYFKSGDIGFMDSEGYVTIVDRIKDMIVVGGFKVFPNEVEEVLASMPGIHECAVVGVEHRKLGEIVKAYIVKDKHDLTNADVLQFCKEQFTSYKRPRKIVFVSELPKSNVGKILRREVRKLGDSSS
ncbi:AMP-binding protein [Polynucleobacter paneuropaeus]|nr:AMP-binding protein [Polynucleobacter paneuropaeus]MBT8531468.1 AMP-binding protein [Polynucleobacter paneuropaeus]MBT8601975.1 AMP-binding protein [Polynucleobacter paneuropaeus]MBT8623927.1 AMP-binding protein [Polynucleobacter paneuropaeus]MBT8629188.1 AMP-binding protein [Polynucleobacter paneuropaeus]